MLKKLQLAVAAVLATVSATVSAAIPASVGTSFTAMQGDVEDVFEIAFPVMLFIVGLTLVWRYVSRYARKI